MQKSSYLYLLSLKEISSTSTSSPVHLLHISAIYFDFCSLIFVGNILMLSEGRPGVDDVYSLADGMQGFRLKESGRICDRLEISLLMLASSLPQVSCDWS